MKNVERPETQACLLAHLSGGKCCALVGLSNTGKSALLRSLCMQEPLPAPLRDTFPVYVDCNRMLELSQQGFYEAILRAVRSRARDRSLEPDLLARLETAYETVVHPASSLSIPLGFNDAMEGLCEARLRPVLVLDEFDEPFQALEGRIFLNLRALRDRYRERLLYVTATARTLEELRDDIETAEFRELFVGQVCRLGMLEEGSARATIAALANEEGVPLDSGEVEFIVRASGGHPGLIHGVFRLLLRARREAPQTYGRMGVRLVEEALAGDGAVCGECERLWAQLTPTERRALLALTRGEQLPLEEQEQLRRLGLVAQEGAVFSDAFAGFVRRFRREGAARPMGLWLDEDAGEVYVDGRRVPTLTELEYRLLQTLYRRMGKLCDKYLLVEEVWGESYIDEVDDARIEKLISRLRAKIEEDPANPRYLITVRGRGYRLVGRPDDELPGTVNVV